MPASSTLLWIYWLWRPCWKDSKLNMGLLLRWRCFLGVCTPSFLVGFHCGSRWLTWSSALSTIPALLYTFLERGILRMNTTVLGARYALYDLCKWELNTNCSLSIWVFTLIAMEAVKTYRTNPYFEIGTTKIPTWITPLVLVLFVSFLIPNTSFLGHVCGLAFGYGCKRLSSPE